MYMFNQRLISY